MALASPSERLRQWVRGALMAEGEKDLNEDENEVETSEFSKKKRKQSENTETKTECCETKSEME